MAKDIIEPTALFLKTWGIASGVVSIMSISQGEILSWHNL